MATELITTSRIVLNGAAILVRFDTCPSDIFSLIYLMITDEVNTLYSLAQMELCLGLFARWFAVIFNKDSTVWIV